MFFKYAEYTRFLAKNSIYFYNNLITKRYKYTIFLYITVEKYTFYPPFL